MELKAEGASRWFFRSNKSSNYFYAVQKTDFTAENGKITVIGGKSGSGKTTFLNMLCGLLSPSEGSILLDGEDMYEMSDSRRSRIRNKLFGVVPQGQTGLKSFTVLENVLIPAQMYGSKTDLTEKAESLLDGLGILELKNVYANELSGGEMRRMSLARALICEPQFIFADEPTSDLDDEATSSVMKLFRICADKGAAVIINTHEKEVSDLADKVYRMDKGVLLPAE